MMCAGLALVVAPSSAAAQSAPVSQTQRTAHYTLELTIGAAEAMVSPMDAMTAQTGEVMVNGGSMMGMGQSTAPSAAMSSPDMSNAGGMGTGLGMGMASHGMDQGMSVNHHLEVRITRNDTGSVVNSVNPTIRVTNKVTAQSRDLPDVMAMFGVMAGPSDIHYGRNVFLPDGTYHVTVTVGSDVAGFRDLLVTDGAPMPSMSMGGAGATAPSSMPGMSSDLVARDGQRLNDQPSAVQTLFQAIWADRATQEWVTEHNASIGRP